MAERYCDAAYMEAEAPEHREASGTVTTDTGCAVFGLPKPAEIAHRQWSWECRAEYAGLIAVLKWFTQRELFDADITIRGDSLLVIQQMFSAWKINKGIYAPMAYKARGLRAQFTNMRGEWIERTTTRLPMGWRRLL